MCVMLTSMYNDIFMYIYGFVCEYLSRQSSGRLNQSDNENTNVYVYIHLSIYIWKYVYISTYMYAYICICKLWSLQLVR
jgi:hypothetical protein